MARTLFFRTPMTTPGERTLDLGALSVVGASHHGADLPVREALATAVADLPAALARIAALPGVHGVAIVSTCNRVEAWLDAEPSSLPLVAEALGGAHAGALQRRTGREAVRHAFRVGTGLDSMSLGDPQILGQWKTAFRAAGEARTLTPLLARLHDRAIKAAREARTKTGVGRRAVSLSHVAVELVQKVYGDLARRRVLIVGTGKMAALAARRLLECGAAATVVAGRRLENAQKLAADLGLAAVPAAALADELVGHDIVVSATSCPVAVLTADMVARAASTRRGQPLILVDLAVPRDVDPQVRQVAGVFLYDVDDLRGVAAANRRERAHDALAAEAIVDEAVASFETEHNDAADAIVQLRRRAEEIRQAELARARRRLGTLTAEQEQTIEAATRAIVNRVLHVPTAQLRLLGGDGHGEELELARAVLGLE